MPPIDPEQLLKALGPLLTNTGGIRGAQEASRISSLMKDASKLVTRCVYLNILRATDSKEALQKFMEVGGWDTLNTWLEMARDDNNEPLLGELLEVYQTMPVNVGLLKQNSAAKTIKQLSKTDKERIKKISALLVENWTKTIREQNSATDNEDEKKRQKRKAEKDKEKDKDSEKNDKENDKKDGKDSEKSKNRERVSKDKEKDSKDRDSKDRSKDSSHRDKRDRDKHKERERDKSKRDKPKTGSSNKDSSSKTSDTLTSKNKESTGASKRTSSLDDSSNSSNPTSTTAVNKSEDVNLAKDEPKRPKTVKQIVTKFRSTGLFDEEDEEETDTSKKIPTEKLPMKRASMDNKFEESAEKKPRLQLTMPTLTPSNVDGSATTPPEVTHGRIKLIAPKRPPAHEIQESNVFMDSLQQASFPSGRKPKKKLVSPSLTTVPVTFKNTSATSPPSASSPPPTTSPPSSEAGPISPPLLSPTTAMAQRLPSVPSFYRDTLDDMPETTNDTKKETDMEDESPPPLIEKDTAETEQEGVSKNGEQVVNKLEEKLQDIKMSENSSNVEENQKLGNGKRSKKSVSWAREAYLEEIFYFEMDETERENVNRPKNFMDMKKAEMLLDRRAMESVKRFNNDTMVEVLQWKKPKPFDNAIVLVEAGCNSVEKRVQMEREQIVLCALFFNKVPDTPIEPDPDTSTDKGETKIIPLEDENGSCTEYEHTYNFNDPSSLPYDPEYGGLPLQNHVPPMNQVNNMGGVNMLMANNMAQMNMGNLRGHMNIPAPIIHIMNTLQQQAQETRDPIIQNLQGMLTNVLQNTNPQDSGMLMERILNALEPFRTQIPGLSNLINSVTANSMDPSMGNPRFMIPNQLANNRHGLLGSAPPGFNMLAGANLRQNLQGPTPVIGNSGGGMGGNQNFFMGGGSSGGGGGGGGNMRMGQWRGSNRSRPFGKRGGHRNIVCQFYVKNGLCKYGESCQFIHPSPNS